MDTVLKQGSRSGRLNYPRSFKLKVAVETIQTFVGLFIGVMVAFLTVLSAETAMIRPSASDIMGTSGGG